MKYSGIRPPRSGSASRERGFTLIEVIIVVSTLAVLSVAVVLVINPVELLRRSRDSQRVTDLRAIEDALNLLSSEVGTYDRDQQGGVTCAGGSGQDTVYVSVPSGQAGAPAAPDGWAWGQVADPNLYDTDGSGWLPVDLTAGGSLGTFLDRVPIDPTNTWASGLYYTYVCGSYELGVRFESQNYQGLMVSDTGDDALSFETGTDISIAPSRPSPGGNSPPTIQDVTDPTSAEEGNLTTFNVDWADSDDTNVSVYICKSNTIDSETGCIGGTWTSVLDTTVDPAEPTYLTDTPDVGVNTYYAFVCDDEPSCSNPTPGTFEVTAAGGNIEPTISSVVDTPDPVTEGNTTTFDVSWSDPNGDTAIDIYICKTNVVAPGTGCESGETWTTASGDPPADPTYVAQNADIATSPNTYYAFACDAEPLCSSSASGTFAVEEVTANQKPVHDVATIDNGPKEAGQNVTFTVNWSDPDNDTAIDIYICKSNLMTNPNVCDDGQWASVSGNPPPDGDVTTLDYTTTGPDVGVQNYSAFICDDEPLCSDPSPVGGGTFTVTNAAPEHTSATTQNGPVSASGTVTFTVRWSDVNDTNITIYICKTGNITPATGCDDGQWTSLSGNPPPGGGTTDVDYVTSASDIGVQNYYAFVCDDEPSCSVASPGGGGTFTVNNNPPTHDDPPGTTDSPEPFVTEGNDVTFSVSWLDADGHQVRAHICKTNVMTDPNVCADGAWATLGSPTSSSPINLLYTTQNADIATSPNNYYAFLCDTLGDCTETDAGFAGAFSVQAPGGTDPHYPNADIGSQKFTATGTGNPNHWAVLDDLNGGSYDNANYVETGTGGANNDYTELGFTGTSTTASVSSVKVYFRMWAQGGCIGGGSNCDTVDVDILLDGAYTGVPQTYTVTASEPGADSSFTFNGTWTGYDDLQAKFTRSVKGTGATKDDNVRITNVWVEVTYTGS